jgi:hypothetical protein
MAYLTRVVGIIVFSPENIDGMTYTPKRRESPGYCKIDACRYEQEYQGQTPGDIDCGGPETIE